MNDYCLLSHAINFLRKLDDFFGQSAAIHNATIEHFHLLVAVRTLGEKQVSARVLAEHLIRDRASTIQLCWRMKELSLLDLKYKSNSAKPQLLISVTEYGENVLGSLTQVALQKQARYLQNLSPEKRKELAGALQYFLWDDLTEKNYFDP